MATNKSTRAFLGSKKTTASIKPAAKPSIAPKRFASGKVSQVKTRRAALKAKKKL